MKKDLGWIPRDASPILRSNRTITEALEDPHLSYRSIGVYAIILATQNTVRVDLRALYGQGRGGRDATRNAVRLLCEHGYLRRVKREGGKIERLGLDEWKIVRGMILERDNFTCQYCGSHENLCVDHVVPLSRGGDNHPFNLVACCRSCNVSKGYMTVDEWKGKVEEGGN